MSLDITEDPHLIHVCRQCDTAVQEGMFVEYHCPECGEAVELVDVVQSYTVDVWIHLGDE